MKKSDTVIADIALYAMKQIQMAKHDRELMGNEDYWTGEIMSMKNLLLYMDKLAGNKKKVDRTLPDLIEVFNRVDAKRKENFDFFWERIWEDAEDEEESL